MRKKFVDYYKVLNVKRTASHAEIKEAYYKLARKYHPDINIFNEVSLMKFTLINEAYSILGDLEKRLKYRLVLEKRDEIVEKARLRKILESKKNK